MRIGLDTVCLVPPFTGIPNYVLHLLSAMVARPDADQHTFLGFHNFSWHDAGRSYVDGIRPEQADRITVNAPDILTKTRRLVSRHPPVHAIATRVRGEVFSASLPRQNVDLFHAFMSRAPGRPRDVPMIPVVYDLSFLRFPDLHPKSRANWLAPVEALCRTAPMIHTISHAVRDEIVQHFGRAPENIAVIEPGVNATYRAPGHLDTDILQRLDINEQRYVLSVSTLEPRKNFKTLLTAYRALRPDERRHMPLVLVGTQGWGDTKLGESLDALKDEGTLRLAGYLSDHDLRTLYKHARAMCYPSLYEGYGMPISEALSLGCSVVVSDTSSMPEAACGQGRCVAPLDVDAWRDELRRIAQDDTLSRPSLRAARQAAVAHLTWERAAQKTFDMYHAVLDRNR